MNRSSGSAGRRSCSEPAYGAISSAPARRSRRRSPHPGEIEPVEQPRLSRLGEHQLAVGVLDVAAQRVTAAGRVQPHRHRCPRRPQPPAASEKNGVLPSSTPTCGGAPGRARRAAAPPRVARGAAMWLRQVTNESSNRHAAVGRRRSSGAGAGLATDRSSGTAYAERLRPGCRPVRGRVAAAARWRPPSANSVCLARGSSGERVVDVDADAAVDVHGGVRDPVSRPRRPRTRRWRTSMSAGRPSPSRHAACAQRQPQTLDVDVAVGQPLRHGLEAADRPVELLALAGVLGGQFEAAVEHAELIGAAPERHAVAQPGRIGRTSAPTDAGRRRARHRASSRCPTLPSPVVSSGVTVTPGSSAATRNTAVPESVSAGTRKASATGP